MIVEKDKMFKKYKGAYVFKANYDVSLPARWKGLRV